VTVAVRAGAGASGELCVHLIGGVTPRLSAGTREVAIGVSQDGLNLSSRIGDRDQEQTRAGPSHPQRSGVVGLRPHLPAALHHSLGIRRPNCRLPRRRRDHLRASFATSVGGTRHRTAVDSTAMARPIPSLTGMRSPPAVHGHLPQILSECRARSGAPRRPRWSRGQAGSSRADAGQFPAHPQGAFMGRI
jgi:hypothetical protein